MRMWKRAPILATVHLEVRTEIWSTSHKEFDMETNTFAVAPVSRAGYAGRAPAPISPAEAGPVVRLWRWIATLVAVSAMTLALTGPMAGSVEASARPNLGTAAERCTDMGGNATVYGIFGVNITYCDWGDGDGVWALD